MERNNNSTVTTTFGESEVARGGCYVCMRCRTHIALPADNCGIRGLVNPILPVFYSFFRKAINLQVAGPAYYQQTRGHTVASVFCATCNTRIGFKYIEVDKTGPDCDREKGDL